MSNKIGLKTFEGVYTPTLLTILGVVLYLRLGWVVGNVGLVGTIIIIALAHAITISTALSMSSMLTNIRIGSGGAYAIITRSLGHEMGGAIGLPLYISQAISIAFYITGFSELWVSFFSNHSITAVGVITWLVLSGISLASAKLAFRLQYGILAAVALSLVSFLTGPNLNSEGIIMSRALQNGSFWTTFAIFFPAVTGVLTGATMSGDLENPRESIIKGTLAAIFTGLAVYIFVAYWFAHQATQEILISDMSIIFKLSSIKIFVIAGVMGAVLSSALSTLVSAPRTLLALAENRVVPFGKIIARQNEKGEPIFAIFVSSAISLIVILAGNLNSLAELLTMFFLTTYGMINLVVFLEQVTGIISYRPSMKMTIFVPIFGALGCLSVMVLINIVFTAVTFVTIAIIYSVLKKRNLTSPWGDVRGGVFVSIAEWAAQKSASIPYHPRLWKPSVAIPVEKPEDFKRVSRFIQNLVYPSGRIYYLTSGEGIPAENEKQIDEVLKPLQELQIFTQKTTVTSPSFESILLPAMQCLNSTFLPPNIILFTVSDEEEKREKLKGILKSVRPLKISVGCLWMHSKYGLGLERRINLWLRDQSPNNDLASLCALQFSRNFGAELNLCRVVDDENIKKQTVKDMMDFIEEARLPANTKVRIFSGDFKDCLHENNADLNIIGMPMEYEAMIEMIDNSPSSILFVASGGLENALI
ncbi:Amino acid transporter [Peptoclostridium litorale DSM 5388]|uniref:Putative transport protein n=1 Tax=Peptoclostridium litorale DSM 5388 TaxID=1121324 RepID=A0A069RNA6_PEPLI|nr:amino acid permease [Peptoclostridium litorale]KDR95647.1 putative transport protein [Peptoclostridium litorale DSM 5388]SIO00196.1 Amino acid transporter [Peptoclostridium litorale DSM 5388]